MIAAAPKRRILCIEDDRAAAALLKRALERSGYEVVTVSSGTEGLARSTEDWQAIIIDYALPDLDGIDVLERMAVGRRLPATVMVTGRGNESLVVRALKLGVDDYLVKDSGDAYLDLLPELVEKACASVQRRQEAITRAAETERLVVELTEALARIKTLSGLIPICAKCKNIRNDEGYWKSVEAYLAERSGVKFSHGLCPDCIPMYFPDDPG